MDGYKKSRTGRTVKLLCPVSGNPIPLTMWTKDGESINDGWERYRVREDGLKIKGVVVEDSGQYVCRATNGFGSVSINFTLTVLGKYWKEKKSYIPSTLHPTMECLPGTLTFNQNWLIFKWEVNLFFFYLSQNLVHSQVLSFIFYQSEEIIKKKITRIMID